MFTQSDKFKNVRNATWIWWWRSHPAWLWKQFALL